MQDQNVIASNLERDMQNRRNLQLARMEAEHLKKEAQTQHVKSVAKGIGAGRVVTQRNDSQKKHALTQQRNNLAQGVKKGNQSTIQEARVKKLNGIIKKYERTPWTVLYVVAAFDDGSDLIPFLSIFTSIGTSIYLNAKLWECGDAQTRQSSRIRRIFLSLVDTVPIINLLPVSIYIVYSAKKSEQARVDAAKKELAKIMNEEE